MEYVVVYESLDSNEQVRAVFLQLDSNILIFYRFTKFFYPNVVIYATAAIQTHLHLRIFSRDISPILVRKLATLAGCSTCISIPNCLDTRLANTRAGKRRGKPHHFRPGKFPASSLSYQRFDSLTDRKPHPWAQPARTPAAAHPRMHSFSHHIPDPISGNIPFSGLQKVSSVQCPPA